MGTNVLSASRLSIISLVLAVTLLKAQPGSPATFWGGVLGDFLWATYTQSVRLQTEFHFVLETQSYNGALTGLDGAYCVDPADLELKRSTCLPCAGIKGAPPYPAKL